MYSVSKLEYSTLAGFTASISESLVSKRTHEDSEVHFKDPEPGEDWLDDPSSDEDE